MKVLVTGCHGLLGQRIVKHNPGGFKVYGSDVSRDSMFISSTDYYACDLTQRIAVDEMINNIKPDCIINCAAYTNVDGAEEERDLCWFVNVVAVENLVQAARRARADIYHISTDYIFNGSQGPYKEEDTPNPLGFYGQSKLAAEQVLKGSPLNYSIIRTMVLYGLSENNRPHFVRWLIDRLSKKQPVHIVTDQYGNTTLNDDLALAIWQLVRTSFHGVLHVAGRDIISRYDFALAIADVFGLDPQYINAITTDDLKQTAPRPLNSGLNVDKAINALGLQMSTVREGLQKYKALCEIDV